MKYVEVKNSIVVSGPWSADILPDLTGSGVTPVDITGIIPEPKEAWVFNGVDFVEATAPEVKMSADDLRKIRDDLLNDSDWKVINGSPLTVEKIEEWKTYRQELRDMPNGYIPIAIPVFPTMPSK